MKLPRAQARVVLDALARLEDEGALARGEATRLSASVEVLSFDDRWRDLHEKVAEYLAAGVTAVHILDPDTTTAHVMHAD